MNDAKYIGLDVHQATIWPRRVMQTTLPLPGHAFIRAAPRSRTLNLEVPRA